MSKLLRAVEIMQRRGSRQSQVLDGKPLALWNDAHGRSITTLIPNPALLPALVRTTDAQDGSGNFYTTPGWDD